MPKNYANGVVYGIYRDDEEKPIYVGSTVQDISVRFRNHIHRAKSNDRMNRLAVYMREQGYDNLYPKVIESYPCENQQQLFVREGFYIKQFDTVNNGFNHVIAGRTKQEYVNDNREMIAKKQQKNYQNNRDNVIKRVKQYSENNEEAVKKTKAEYFQKNKNKIYKHREEINEKIECECGKVLNKLDIAAHKKTKRHIGKMKAIEEGVEFKYSDRNDKFDCECGGKFTGKHRNEHFKSDKHKNYLLSQQLNSLHITNEEHKSEV